MRRRTTLYVVLVAFGIAGIGFCADYTQHEDFGVKKPGDVVSFTVTPPGEVLSGRVDAPGGFVWVGGPATWIGTIPQDFAGVHNGNFSGTYKPPSGPGPGPSRIYTWEADTKADVVYLKTETEATIPADRTRRKLGVGEEDILTLVGADGSVTWSKTGPGIVYPTSGISTKFTAHEQASSPSVTATYKGKTYTANFTVVEPSSESAVKTSEDTFPAGTQGAGMNLKVTLHPTDVSFNWVEIRELPGPPSNITGYFTNYPADYPPLQHNPPSWLPVGEENDTTDHAHFEDWPPPWHTGGYQWIIPMEWCVKNGFYVGTLPNRVQAHSITDTNGTSTITKLGQSVTRTP